MKKCFETNTDADPALLQIISTLIELGLFKLSGSYNYVEEHYNVLKLTQDKLVKDI